MARKGVKIKRKRGSFSLSINAIVILIIAIAVLGIILGFVTKNIQSAANRLESYAIEDCGVNPSVSEPLVLDPENLRMKYKETRPVCVGLYNEVDDLFCCIYVEKDGGKVTEADGYIYDDTWKSIKKDASLKAIILVHPKPRELIQSVEIVGKCYPTAGEIVPPETQPCVIDSAESLAIHIFKIPKTLQIQMI